MEPMKPMAPMAPMKPMAKSDPWWPKDLGEPATSGGQNGMDYAFFPDKKRLLVRQDGETVTYDSGDERIDGVSQRQGGSHTLSFTSQNGTVDLTRLKRL